MICRSCLTDCLLVKSFSANLQHAYPKGSPTAAFPAGCLSVLQVVIHLNCRECLVKLLLARCPSCDPCPGLRLTPPKPRGWDAQLSIGNISPDHGSRASLPAIADGSPSPSEAVSPSGSVSVEVEHRLTGCTASRRNSDGS